MSALPKGSTCSRTPDGGRGLLTETFGDRVLFALASGSFCGWDRDYARIADPFLDALCEWVRAERSFDEVAERTVGFLRAIRERYPDELIDHEFHEDNPLLQVVGALARESSVVIFWVGGGGAHLVRDSQVIRSTTPHLLGNDPRFKPTEGGPPADAAIKHCTILGAPIETTTWDVRPGDSILLLDFGLWSSPRAEWGDPIELATIGRNAEATRQKAISEKRTVGAFAGTCAVLEW